MYLLYVIDKLPGIVFAYVPHIIPDVTFERNMKITKALMDDIIMITSTEQLNGDQTLLRQQNDR